MLNIFRKKATKAQQQANHEQTGDAVEKISLFGRLKQGLTRTRKNFGDGLSQLLLGKKNLDDALLEELEAQLLMADIGVDLTQNILQRVTDKLSRNELSDGDAVYQTLQDELQAVLAPCEQGLAFSSASKPYVILMVGINGAGKTTTIGKLAKRLQAEGKSVMLAAGDTFRAAAIEQLQVWGERNQVPVIAQQRGADSASVIFDALQAAKARGVDVLIADTAGRLHTQQNLMQELAKIGRVIKKLDAEAPHEVMLVLDGGVGQNALQQVAQFNEAVPLTGLTITKLDGTAKGGIVFAIADKWSLPIRYIGVGERIEDLREFIAKDFVDALFEPADD